MPKTNDPVAFFAECLMNYHCKLCKEEARRRGIDLDWLVCG